MAGRVYEGGRTGNKPPEAKHRQIVRRALAGDAHRSYLRGWSGKMKQKRTNLAYDVFVSYHHSDGVWVQNWLLRRLEEAGLKACVDFRDFQPGAPLIVQMEEAIAQSRFTLLVLSPDYLHSEWAAWEIGLVEAFDPAERQRRVIPLLLRPCELPMRIATLSYVDFTRPSEIEVQLNRLLFGLGVRTPLSPDRSVPTDTMERLPPATKEPREYSRTAIRDLLAAAMSDEELTLLCFDHFRNVYESFTTGMSKPQRIQILLDYCERRARVDELLAVVRMERPYQYERFQHQLEQR